MMKNEYSVILDKKTISSTIIRLAHEIYERNKNLDNLVLIGIQTKGFPFSKRIHMILFNMSNIYVTIRSVDITFYRDYYRDQLLVPHVPVTNISFTLDSKLVVVVDDVFYTV